MSENQNPTPFGDSNADTSGETGNSEPTAAQSAESLPPANPPVGSGFAAQAASTAPASPYQGQATPAYSPHGYENRTGASPYSTQGGAGSADGTGGYGAASGYASASAFPSAQGTYGYGGGAYAAPEAFPAGAGYAPEPPLDQPWYGIGFFDAMKRFFRKYAVFSGRASRGEYWWSILGVFLMSVVASLVSPIPVLGPILGIALSLGLVVPNIAVSVRRLHDTNLSGWYCLLPFAFQVIAGIIGLAGLIPIFIEVGADPSLIDSLSEDELANLLIPALGGFGIAFFIAVVGFIVSLVLMVRRPNPAGARFDARPAAGQQPYYGI